MKKGKKYLAQTEKFDKNKLYTKEEAVKLVKENSYTRLDDSVEVDMQLNIETKKA